MGGYYKELGYSNPIDMLYEVTRDEATHYKLLVGFILNVAKIKNSFLKISTNPETNRAFCKAYNRITIRKEPVPYKTCEGYVMKELIRIIIDLFCVHNYETKDICQTTLHSQMVCLKCGKKKYKFYR